MYDSKNSGIAWRDAGGDVAHYGRHQHVTGPRAGVKAAALPRWRYGRDVQLGGIEFSTIATSQGDPLVRRHSEQFSGRSDEGQQQPGIIVRGAWGKGPVNQLGLNELLDIGLETDRRICASKRCKQAAIGAPCRANTPLGWLMRQSAPAPESEAVEAHQPVAARPPC